MSRQQFFAGSIVNILTLVFLLSFDVSAPFGFAPGVYAQDADREQSASNSGRETKRMPSLSQKGFPLVRQAQESIEANDPAGAIAALEQILNNPTKFKEYDVAAAYKMRGHVWIVAENFEAALADFANAIASSTLPEWDVLNLQFNMAQLYLAQDQVGNAINMLEQWFALVEKPNAAAYFFAARAYAQGERWVDAERNVEQGLAKMDPRDPKESWYRIASVIYLQRQKYADAEPLLETMISHWPGKKEYYNQLSAVYSELGREKDSFAVLAMAHDNKLDLSSGELVRLGQLYRFYEYPYRGAKVIEQGIKDGTLKQTKKVCEEMGNAYFQAREMSSAMKPLECAAKASQDGNIWLRLCQVHMQQDSWSRAESACRFAIAKGGLQRQAGMGEQLLGIALYEQGKREEAIKLFEACMEHEESSDLCVMRKSAAQAEMTRERLERERLESFAKAEAERQKEIEDQIRQIEQDAKLLRSMGSENAAELD